METNTSTRTHTLTRCSQSVSECWLVLSRHKEQKTMKSEKGVTWVSSIPQHTTKRLYMISHSTALHPLVIPTARQNLCCFCQYGAFCTCNGCCVRGVGVHVSTVHRMCQRCVTQRSASGMCEGGVCVTYPIGGSRPSPLSIAATLPTSLRKVRIIVLASVTTQTPYLMWKAILGSTR